MRDLVPRLAQLRETALDFLFPRWCLGCGKEGAYFCLSCRRVLPRLVGLVCPRCGLPQAGGIECPACAGSQSPLERIRSPYRFEGVIRQAVHQLKYRNLRALAPVLAAMMDDYLTANPLSADVLVPVPLHPRRLRERGYNQSELLARGLGRNRGIPVESECLERRRDTSAQARTAGREERLRNVAGAFGCRDGRLEGAQVLLTDDVATSGATLGACAGALREAGAASVSALVLAREI